MICKWSKLGEKYLHVGYGLKKTKKKQYNFIASTTYVSSFSGFNYLQIIVFGFYLHFSQCCDFFRNAEVHMAITTLFIITPLPHLDNYPLHVYRRVDLMKGRVRRG